MKNKVFIALILLIPALAKAQNTNQGATPQRRSQGNNNRVMSDSLLAQRAVRYAAALKKYNEKVFTHADTLRGSIGPERAWWDVLRYDVTVKPEFKERYTSGNNLITYKVVQDNYPLVMQIDLRQPLNIDSVILNGKTKLSYTREGECFHVKTIKQKKGSVNTVQVFFSGKPMVAVRPPWNGGWSFLTDSLGRPWMTVTCQGGAGASIWYPCKDHQSDEPDNGASLTMIAPDSLVAVSNGRLQFKKSNGDGTTSTKWAVVNPISNYCLIPYIGKYVNFSEVYNGEKGKLDVNYWVLDYNLKKAKAYMPLQVHNMLTSHEYWFGPYPFYEDGYKLVDVNHTGMEHQSAVAYGNHYAFGYVGRDESGTGWGSKWDFIIVHESGHEWFGNNITTNDLADMWVHEGFTNYSESLFVEKMYGKEAGIEYNDGVRKNIHNDFPIIARYGVNEQGSGDMYPKGSNMLQSIRHSIDNDDKWRGILRGLNKTFYHKTVNSSQIEKYISDNGGFDYSHVFDQYLRTVQIPKFEYYFSADHKQVSYHWVNCVKGFNFPLVLANDKTKVRIMPTEEWKTTSLADGQADLFDVAAIKKMYYFDVSVVAGK
jgi:aminopeptidase N